MDTRSQLPGARPFFSKRCVYCANPADTNDHAPPRCFLQRPFPANLITLPACRQCNGGFSFQEEVVRSILTLVSTHPDLIAERQPGGRLYRALERNAKLRTVLEQSHQIDGNYALTDEVLSSFQRVFCKTLQGIFFGLYGRIVPSERLKLLRVENRRLITPEELIDQLRPSPLRDITDEPLSEITPNSWHSREPIITIKLQPLNGGPPVDRIFRLIRETPPEWVNFQPGIFSFAVVKGDDEGSVCVFDLWETLLIAMAAPWPDNRGPMRRGRNNPMSRDGKNPS